MNTPTIIKCRTCNTIASFVALDSYNSGRDGEAAAAALLARGGKPSFAGLPCVGALLCCGKRPTIHEVKGIFRPAHKCGPKCLHSTGKTCECACGGKNHGRGYATEAA